MTKPGLQDAACIDIMYSTVHVRIPAEWSKLSIHKLAAGPHNMSIENPSSGPNAAVGAQ